MQLSKRGEKVIPAYRTAGEFSIHPPADLFRGLDAARQLSGDGRRQGPGENPVGLSCADAKAGFEVLRNQRAWRSRPGLSHEGLGRDRKEARETFLIQQRETQISGSREL